MALDTNSPPKGASVDWTDEERERIERLCARYPTRRAAILPVLWMAQDKWAWLSTDVFRLVAATLDLPKSEVLAVASFYTMFKKRPGGRYTIQVCHTLPCALRGADRIVAHLENRLGIQVGETTEDGLFSLERVECLASCGSAPMMQVGEHYYELLTPERVDEILDAFRKGSPLATPRPEAHQWRWDRSGEAADSSAPEEATE